MCRKKAEAIRDWEDLFQPTLRGRVGFVEAPREFVGTVLKASGLSFNATAKDLANCGTTRAALREKARSLKEQVTATPALPSLLCPPPACRTALPVLVAIVQS